MPLERAGASVVVVAHHFNPSVVSEVWLSRHELLRGEDKMEGCVFTDAIVNVSARQYNLLVTPDQLQFGPKGPPETHQDLILAKVGAFVDLLPHIPYHAVGMNFVWNFVPASENIAALSRRLFFIENRPIFRDFDTLDAQFGAYLSKDFRGCRLKLDIKPVTRTAISPSNVQMSPALNLAFNFHLDVLAETNQPGRIREMLGRWNEAKEEAERIAREAEDLQ